MDVNKCHATEEQFCARSKFAAPSGSTVRRVFGGYFFFFFFFFGLRCSRICTVWTCGAKLFNMVAKTAVEPSFTCSRWLEVDRQRTNEANCGVQPVCWGLEAAGSGRLGDDCTGWLDISVPVLTAEWPLRRLRYLLMGRLFCFSLAREPLLYFARPLAAFRSQPFLVV